jgi:DNA-directed RNA polymerase subunit RPC12/RpoP
MAAPSAPPPGLEPRRGASTPPADGGGAATRTFSCERCGAELAFSIGAQALRCEHCGFERALGPGDREAAREHDLAAALDQEARRRAEGAAPLGDSAVTCTACGATVVFEGTLTSSRCAYCGQPLERDAVHAAPGRIPVDALLTFAVEGPAARAALAAWVRRLWLAPGAFVSAGIEGRLDGVYLPYFTFDAGTATAYRGQRGDHEWVEVGFGQGRQRERRTSWHAVAGDFQRFFDDVLIPAVSTLPAGLLTRLEPWPLGAIRPFAPEALAGKLAHTYDVDLAESSVLARRRIESAIEAEVRQRIGGDEQRLERIQTEWSGLTYKHLLLPVWLLAYRYGDRSYRVAVNACSGEVTGERPYSPWKVALLAAAALAGLALLASLGAGR